MKDDVRMVTTVVIWIAFTIIMGLIMAALVISRPEMNPPEIGALLIIVIGLMMTVSESTKSIWSARSNDTEDKETARLAKSKRAGRSRIERLIAELDDEDIYDLEALLLARDADGEISRKQTR